MRVLVDVDGVLADFVGAYLCVASDEYFRATGNARLFSRDEVTDWDICSGLGIGEIRDAVNSRVSAPGFANSLDTIDPMVQMVNNLIAEESGEIVFVTSPWKSSPTWKRDRLAWLECHFGDAGRNVIFTGEKYGVRGDIMIDDRYENLVSWKSENPNGVAIIASQPWNYAQWKADELGVCVSDCELFPDDECDARDWERMIGAAMKNDRCAKCGGLLYGQGRKIRSPHSLLNGCMCK